MLAASKPRKYPKLFFYFFICLTSLGSLSAVNAAPSFSPITLAVGLPTSYEGAQWGMSLTDLQKLTTVKKASQKGHYNYADHGEVNPDVYIRETPDHKRIEYYFFNKKLYKIYVVFPKSASSTPNYLKQLAALKQQYGPALDNYQETYFGLKIQHNKWQDTITSLDFRYGAGFIYEVWVNKQAAKNKSLQLERDKSI